MWIRKKQHLECCSIILLMAVINFQIDLPAFNIDGNELKPVITNYDDLDTPNVAIQKLMLDGRVSELLQNEISKKPNSTIFHVETENMDYLLFINRLSQNPNPLYLGKQLNDSKNVAVSELILTKSTQDILKTIGLNDDSAMNSALATVVYDPRFSSNSTNISSQCFQIGTVIYALAYGDKHDVERTFHSDLSKLILVNTYVKCIRNRLKNAFDKQKWILALKDVELLRSISKATGDDLVVGAHCHFRMGNKDQAYDYLHIAMKTTDASSELLEMIGDEFLVLNTPESLKAAENAFCLALQRFQSSHK